MSTKHSDLLVLIGLGVAATLATLMFHLNFFASTLLYFALPSFFLLSKLRVRDQWHHIVAMSVVFGVLYGFIFAYIAERNFAWSWPVESYIGTPYLLFDVVNPAALLWFFLWVTYIVLFYEHFLERDRKDRLTVRVLYAAVPAVAFLGIIYLAETVYPAFLDWKYAYAMLCFLALLPCAVLLKIRPNICKKLFVPALFFVPLHLAHEVTGLLARQWDFPGYYLALVPVVPGGLVPIEEIVIWIILGSVIVVSYYELYIDDER